MPSIDCDKEKPIGTTEIIQEYSERYLVPKKTVSTFIKNLISIICDFVSQGKTVNVKGLFIVRVLLVKRTEETRGKAIHGCMPYPEEFYRVCIKAGSLLKHAGRIAKFQQEKTKNKELAITRKKELKMEATRRKMLRDRKEIIETKDQSKLDHIIKGDVYKIPQISDMDDEE